MKVGRMISIVAAVFVLALPASAAFAHTQAPPPVDEVGEVAQVLRRIEELEEREREMEEILAEVMAVADEHGLGTGAAKAFMDA